MADSAGEVSVEAEGWEKGVDDRSVYCSALREGEVCDGEWVDDTREDVVLVGESCLVGIKVRRSKVVGDTVAFIRPLYEFIGPCSTSRDVYTKVSV